MEFFLLIFLVAILAFPIYFLCKDVSSFFNHSGWNAISNPSSDATIIDVKSEEVQYAKNNAKYKTTVTFSDGFYFVTHETNRENSFFSYKITVDKFLMSRIIDNAKRAHEKAVIKATKKK